MMKFKLNENQFIDIINEAKSISDVVRKVAEYLSDVIVGDLSNRQEKRRVGMVDMFFKEGELDVDLSGFAPNLGNITLKYTIYTANEFSELEEYARIANISLNSEYDDETNTLTVVSYMNSDGNVVMDDVDESIYHELTHMFQYANGMEKRVSLYDRMRNILEYKVDFGENCFYSAYALYYTFPHEQDAFTHQYYRKLKGGEDISIDSYQPFAMLVSLMDRLKANKDDEGFIKAVNYLGFSRKDYFNRIKFAIKRFKKKLLNAEEALRINENMMKKNIDHRFLSLTLESIIKHGWKYAEYGVERFYRF